MNPSTIAISLIFIPAFILAAVVFFIFRNKKYSFVALSLYLFSSAVVVLSRSLETSLSFIITGVFVLFSGYVYTKDKNVKKYTFFSSLIVFILFFSVYSYLVFSDSIVLKEPRWEIAECDNFYDNYYNKTYENCKMRVILDVDTKIPITDTLYGKICRDGLYMYHVVFKKSENKKYVGTLNYIRPEDIENSTLCISTYSDFSCEKCFVSFPITKT